MREQKHSKGRAPRNRTLALNDVEVQRLGRNLMTLKGPASLEEVRNKTIWQDTREALDFLPGKFVDLVFVDPPYNLSKTFNSSSFREMDAGNYEKWLDSWIGKMVRVLKPHASVYVCGDWSSSGPLFNVLSKHFTIRNRITWEREKGRGAETNWKNSSEDIWFCTVSKDYVFNVDAVKLKRKVVAPYRDAAGRPKDWEDGEDGRYRNTHPSNLWTDISVPFWSMPENTDHPTQKPEKLVAKIILASSNQGHFVFDPFLGSGTTSVVAKKLGRAFLGIETDEYYCCLAEKRLEMAERDASIQGYSGGVFWERNTLADQKSGQGARRTIAVGQKKLFL